MNRERIEYKPWDSFESEYLYFEWDRNYEGKTKLINVISRSKSIVLGHVRWYGPWRQYCFAPVGDTVWNGACIADIQTVIKALMDERKDRLRNR